MYYRMRDPYLCRWSKLLENPMLLIILTSKHTHYQWLTCLYAILAAMPLVHKVYREFNASKNSFPGMLNIAKDIFVRDYPVMYRYSPIRHTYSYIASGYEYFYTNVIAPRSGFRHNQMQFCSTHNDLEIMICILFYMYNVRTL